MIDHKNRKIQYGTDKLIEDSVQDVKGDEKAATYQSFSFEQMKEVAMEGIVLSCR